MKPKRGRPRSFDRGAALDAALATFCRNGYQGTSMSELSAAMQMNPPSIYNTFIDKEHLFIEVLGHYHKPFEHFLRDVFETGGPINDRIFALFSASKQQHACDGGVGCLIANSGTAASDPSSAIASKLKELHIINETLILKGLEKAQAEGEIPKSANVEKIARYLNAIFQGAAISARGQQCSQVVNDILDQGYEGFLKMIA